MFGQQNTSPFASPPASTPFGAPATSTFGGTPAPATPFGSTGVFGSAPAAGGFGAAPATGGFGAPAFGSFGAPAPAPTGFGGFGTTGGFGTPASAPTTSPFGAPAPAQGLFGSTAPAPSQGLFGGGATTFGSSSTQPTGGFGGFGSTTSTQSVFGAPAPSAFGAAPAPSAFGAPAPAAGGIFGSAPAPATAFGAPASGGLFGAPAPAPLFGHTPSPAPGLFGVSSPAQIGAGGSRIVPFRPTTETDNSLSFNFQCMTAQREYATKTFEELRYEDYLQGNRGDGSQVQQSTGGLGVGGFGSTASAPATGFGGFGSPAPAPMGFGGSSAGAPTAFGVAAPAPFGASAPIFGAPAPSAFGAAPAPAFGAPAPAFGVPAPAPTFGSFGAAKPPATGIFGSSPPAAAPAGGIFGSAPAPTGGIFGSAAAPAPSGLFGTPASSAFGAPAPAASGLFGAPAPSAFGAAPAPAPGGLFGAPAPPAGGLFGAPAPAVGGLFGAPAPAPTTAFGFGAQQPAPAMGSLFGASPPSTSLFGTPSPAPGGFFGVSAAPAPPTGVFGAPSYPVPAPAAFAPPYMIVQQPYDAALEQALTAVENQRKELEAMEVWGGRSQRVSSVSPASQSESQALRVSPYRASSVSVLPYRASPKSSVRIHPRGFVSPKPVSLAKSPMPIMSPDGFIASRTKRLVIKCETPKPSMRLRLRDVAVEENKEEEVLHLPEVNRPVLQNVTSPPVTTLPFTSPPAAATPAEVTTPSDSAKTPETTPTNGHGYDFYNKVIASAGATPGSKKVAPRGESESLVPKLTKSDYAVVPSLDEMASMSEADLATVSGFTVTRAGVGSVSWEGSVDVRGVDLDEAISINHRDVAVYDTAEAKGTKPSVGTKLNRPAVITMYNILPKEGSDAEAVEKFKQRIDKSTKRMNAELISYDAIRGVWKFRVPHFSRYGLFDDSEEEDEDMQVETEQVEPSLQHFESGERGGRSPGRKREITKEDVGNMDVEPRRVSAFVIEDESMADVAVVSDVEMGVENNVLCEAERAYKMMSATVASERSRKKQPKSILRKKQREAEASELFPDESAVIKDSVSHNRILPDEKNLVTNSRPGVCARIAQRCGVQSFSDSSTDFGMRMGRTFRVGWKPDGSFLHLQSGSTVVLQQSKPVFTDESNGRFAEKLLETHLKHSTRIASPSRECPPFSLATEGDSAEGTELRKALSDYVVACDRQGGKDSDPEQGLILMRAFSLLLCLLTAKSNSPNDVIVTMIEGSEGSKAQLALWEQGRIDDCVKWLVAACAEDVRKDVRDALQKNDVYSGIFAALSGGDIEQASSIAIKQGRLHLASLVAAGAAGFNSIQDQVQQWHKRGAATIPAKLLRIYTLLGGDLNAEEQIHFASIKAGKTPQLDWRRRLCMLLTFSPRPDDESNLQSLIAEYESNIVDNVAPYPFPRYLSNKLVHKEDDAQCLLYRILKLLTTTGGSYSESNNASVSLAIAVAPSGYTAASSDFSGSFHIAAAISALGLGPSLSPLEQARLLDGYASQLVNSGRWDLAVYVMLCCFRADVSEDLVSRERIAKTLVLHNCSEMSSPELLAKRSNLEKIGVPAAWFEEAAAYRCAHRGDSYEYVRHLSHFDPEHSCGAVENLVVPNMLFFNVVEVRKGLALLDVLSWDDESLAATVLDFFRLSDDILALSQNENGAKEREEDIASLSAIAASVKERLLVHRACTEGIKKISCGLSVIPSYRVVPMAAFLAEALAGISFLQLQLGALKAGSSIWGEEYLRGTTSGRQFKVASELAFIAARDAGVSPDSTAIASEVTLRGLI